MGDIGGKLFLTFKGILKLSQHGIKGFGQGCYFIPAAF